MYNTLGYKQFRAVSKLNLHMSRKYCFISAVVSVSKKNNSFYVSFIGAQVVQKTTQDISTNMSRLIAFH